MTRLGKTTAQYYPFRAKQGNSKTSCWKKISRLSEIIIAFFLTFGTKILVFYCAVVFVEQKIHKSQEAAENLLQTLKMRMFATAPRKRSFCHEMAS